MEQAESFKLIDCFYASAPVIDQWTFVLAEKNPYNGYWTMIATDNTGRGFSQMCEGKYDPQGDNSHLGERPRYISETLVRHILWRLSDE